MKENQTIEHRPAFSSDYTYQCSNDCGYRHMDVDNDSEKTERSCGPPVTDVLSLHPAVLLYVRNESDEVFDALVLKSPTLQSLMDAVSLSLPLHHFWCHYYLCMDVHREVRNIWIGLGWNR